MNNLSDHPEFSGSGTVLTEKGYWIALMNQENLFGS